MQVVSKSSVPGRVYWTASDLRGATPWAATAVLLRNSPDSIEVVAVVAVLEAVEDSDAARAVATGVAVEVIATVEVLAVVEVEVSEDEEAVDSAGEATNFFRNNPSLLKVLILCFVIQYYRQGYV